MKRLFTPIYYCIEKFIFKKHLEAGEKIFFVAHKHWAAILKPFLTICIFGFLTPWLLYVLFQLDVMFYIALVWTIIAFIKLTYILLDWFCDAWLITSLGIVDLEWKGIFQQTSSRIEYPSIEGVSYEFKGFWQTILKFGKTNIDRISSANPVILETAANPKVIELKVLFHKNKFEEEKGRLESKNLKELLSNIVLKHIKEDGTNTIHETLFESPQKKYKNIPIEDLTPKK